MTTLEQTEGTVAALGARRAKRVALRRLLRNPLGVASGAVLLIVVFLGVAGPSLAPSPPDLAQLSAINARPFSPGHVLGGDGSGRDILSRLLAGARQPLIACVLILAVALSVGVTAGLVAGFYRGNLERVINWVSDAMLSMPGLVVLLALYSHTGPNIVAAMTVFGLLISPSYYRLVRGIVHAVRTEPYVDAARVMGLSDARIIGRHILWSVRAPIIVQSAFVLGAGIGIEAALDFLGLGNAAVPSWGAMLQEAFTNIYGNGFAVLWPAAAITITVMALVLLGNATRDALQVAAAKPVGRRRLARMVEDESKHTQEPVPDLGDSLLSVRGLRIAYPSTDSLKVVVDGVNLQVRRGEIRGLVGESGSGKSQTAFAVLGILPRGAIVLDGAVDFDGVDLVGDVSALRNARGRRIAYVPQEPMANLDPSFTIGAQLVHGLRATRRTSRAAAKREVLALLSRVGIRDPERVFGQYPHQISGGMAQRVLICGAVASEPDFIIADEPTTALDVTVQAEVLSLFRELRDERGLGILLVTHNFGVVADICDSVSVMKAGQIVEHGDVREIFHRPQQQYTRDLLAATRRVDLEEQRVD